ncbi:MAG: LuxR C-terminal-related transcriptional regulator [Rikenellaceae bacterium]|jgi:DNA-binding NarL/FixJ family response regulator|nr:LuxR C-terminal-related transcriptional regulator [Rikenellaceae bacterium]
MSAPLKIAVAESSIIVRSGIIVLLKQIGTLHFEVFEIAEMEQLRHAIAWQKPDVLMVNPVSLGLITTPQQVRKEAANHRLKCVALQFSLIDQATLKEYDEVISLYDSADQIREKITRLANEPDTVKRHESLSAREKEVIVCVIKGMTNKQIAEKLFLSTHTVITHRRNISAKLQIHSAAGLTIYAIINKLIDLNDLPKEV